MPPENAFRGAVVNRTSLTQQGTSTQLKCGSFHRCTCQGGSVGNGFVCYGNIMERLQDLNTEVGGRWQGKLTSALSLMGKWPHASRVSSCWVGVDLALSSPPCSPLQEGAANSMTQHARYSPQTPSDHLKLPLLSMQCNLQEFPSRSAKQVPTIPHTSFGITSGFCPIAE